MPDKKASTIVMEGRSGGHGPGPKPWSPSRPLSRYPLIQHTNTANTLRTNLVRTVLNRLFAAAARDDETPRWRKPGISWETATAQERADASESAYMPISRQGGELLYIL